MLPIEVWVLILWEKKHHKKCRQPITNSSILPIRGRFADLFCSQSRSGLTEARAFSRETPLVIQEVEIAFGFLDNCDRTQFLHCFCCCCYCWCSDIVLLMMLVVVFLMALLFQLGGDVPLTLFALQTLFAPTLTDLERSQTWFHLNNMLIPHESQNHVHKLIQDCNGDALVTCEDYTMIHKVRSRWPVHRTVFNINTASQGGRS